MKKQSNSTPYTDTYASIVQAIDQYEQSLQDIGRILHSFQKDLSDAFRENYNEFLHLQQIKTKAQPYPRSYKKLVTQLKTVFEEADCSIVSGTLSRLQSATQKLNDEIGMHLNAKNKKSPIPIEETIAFFDEKTTPTEDNPLRTTPQETFRKTPQALYFMSATYQNLPEFLHQTEVIVIQILIEIIKNIEALLQFTQETQKFLNKNDEKPLTEKQSKTYITKSEQLIAKSLQFTSDQLSALSQSKTSFTTMLQKEIKKHLEQFPENVKSLTRQYKKQIKPTWITYYSAKCNRHKNVTQIRDYLCNTLALHFDLLLIEAIAVQEIKEIRHSIHHIGYNELIARQKEVVQVMLTKATIRGESTKLLKKEESLNEATITISNSLNYIRQKVAKFREIYPIAEHLNIEELTCTKLYALKPFYIRSRLLLDLIFQQNYYLPIQQAVSQILLATSEAANDIISLQTRMAVSGLTPEEEQSIIQSQKTFFEQKIAANEAMTEEICQALQTISEEFTDHIQFKTFINTAGNLSHFGKTSDTKKTIGILSTTADKINQQIRNFITQLWYRRSHGILIKERLKTENEAAEAEDQFSRIGASLYTLQGKENKIPYHYIQLFLRKQQYSPNLWVGRKNEADDFHLLYKQYQNIRSGGIIVTGERNAGKSYFCQHMASMHSPGKSMYTVTAPAGGSIARKNFLAALTDSLEAEEKGWAEAMDALPADSIIILEDLELWWYRGENGNSILQLIGKLVDKYSHKILFLANVSRQSYRIIQKIHPISTIFPGEVRLLPFEAREIEQIILRRHHAGEMHFEIDNRHEKNFRSWHYARLFSRYFAISKGNIGTALLLWISNITSVEGDQIFMTWPKIPNELPMETLDDLTIILLLQLILHRQMHADRLAALLTLKKEETQAILMNLYRKIMVIHDEAGIYEINPAIYRLLVDHFTNIELL